MTFQDPGGYDMAHWIHDLKSRVTMWYTGRPPAVQRTIAMDLTGCMVVMCGRMAFEERDKKRFNTRTRAPFRNLIPGSGAVQKQVG